MNLLGRIVFWDFKRGSWQYDILVVAILAFILATPRDFFHDQPRATTISILPADQQGEHYLLDPKLLDGVAAEGLTARAADLIAAKFKKRPTITHVEPLLDAEGEVIGYSATSAPVKIAK